MIDPTSGASRTSTRRIAFLAISATFAVAIIIAARSVMLPFVLAIVVAYVLTPFVRRAEKKMPRWTAILAVYAVTLGATAGFFAMIVPRLITEGQSLANEWPRFVETSREKYIPAMDERLSRWTGKRIQSEVVNDPVLPPEERPAPIRVIKREDGSFDVRIDERVSFREEKDGVWRIERAGDERGISSLQLLREGFDKAVDYLRQNSLELLRIGRAIVAAISRAIFILFMTLMLAAYIMLTREKILGFFRELWSPPSRPAFDRFLRHLDRGLSGVVRGQLLICLVNGVLSAIGFWLFDLRYWPILSLVAAVLSPIPIFGAILSSIPAVLIGLTQSPAVAFGVLAWILGIHQLEANFLNPKIIGDAAKIHPVLVVFSLLVGEHFFQITGALFAVPCLSIAQTIFLHFRESTMGLPDPTASIPPAALAGSVRTPVPAPSPTGISDLGVAVAAVEPVEPAPDTARAGGVSRT